MKYFFSKVSAFLATLAFLSTASFVLAKENEKITICHVTGSEKNHFVEITVNEEAVDTHLSHGDKFIVDGKCKVGGPN